MKIEVFGSSCMPTKTKLLTFVFSWCADKNTYTDVFDSACVSTSLRPDIIHIPHTHTHVRTHTHTHTHARAHTHARTHARTHAHTHTQRVRGGKRKYSTIVHILVWYPPTPKKLKEENDEHNVFDKDDDNDTDNNNNSEQPDSP